MALGDLAFEEAGKFAGMRVLPDGKVEATYQGTGKLFGVDYSSVYTGVGLVNEKRPLFDIVTGTSIGAMNGAIIVRNVTKDGGRSYEDPSTWEESAKKVKEFWRVQQQFPTYADFFDMNPLYHYWYDILHNTSKVFKHSANELIELYSNMNPTLKSYVDILTMCLLMEPGFWKDYFIKYRRDHKSIGNLSS